MERIAHGESQTGQGWAGQGSRSKAECMRRGRNKGLGQVGWPSSAGLRLCITGPMRCSTIRPGSSTAHPSHGNLRVADANLVARGAIKGQHALIHHQPVRLVLTQHSTDRLACARQPRQSEVRPDSGASASSSVGISHLVSPVRTTCHPCQRPSAIALFPMLTPVM